MTRPLFYAVRRTVRGPRGAIQKVSMVRTMVTSKARAIKIARAEARDDVFNEIEALAIGARGDRLIVVETVWSSRG